MSILAELDLGAAITNQTNLAALGARALNIFVTFNNLEGSGVAVMKHDDLPDQIIASFLGPGVNSGRIQGCGGPIFGRNVTLAGSAADIVGYVQLLDSPIPPWGTVRAHTSEEGSIAPAGSSTPIIFTPSPLWFSSYHVTFAVNRNTHWFLSMETEGTTGAGLTLEGDITAGAPSGLDLVQNVTRSTTIQFRNDDGALPLSVVTNIYHGQRR